MSKFNKRTYSKLFQWGKINEECKRHFMCDDCPHRGKYGNMGECSQRIIEELGECMGVIFSDEEARQALKELAEKRGYI